MLCLHIWPYYGTHHMGFPYLYVGKLAWIMVQQPGHHIAWSVGPSTGDLTTRTRLEESLLKLGFNKESTTVCTAVLLEEVPDAPRPISNFHTIPTTTLELVGERCDVEAAAFSCPAYFAEHIKNSAPAAYATLWAMGGVAELQGLATLERARGQRVGQALISHCVAEAKRMGHKIITTSAWFPETYRLYARNGFTEICSVKEYSLGK
ncbi:hypothetical protein K493DRAFT_373160 [Basidiobolus meristosporus CBS 931.73]|uniref:N-acetyltransferase domain-containing protein n=1 Tax=Basidiobolus meristosporus CBS 931.73 TaxID=1314790 RepID=A0A1Y1YA32_9FUNG|nr:hypothetical protein K493DRAFT_373160 [Basidiobolus meristosporus CBS 931.73]|eukprot:ORX94838.1 hypothetical protein K493DRAFT_373160 [Basidiobolus meristosporus CBS 931.73]